MSSADVMVALPEIFMAVAEMSGPREPMVLPKQMRNPARSHTLGQVWSNQSMTIPPVERL